MGTTKAPEPKPVAQMEPEATGPKTVVQMAPEAGAQKTDDHLRIFLSHKLKDRVIAETIKNKLELLGSDRLEIFLSEGIPFGEDWSEELHQALRDSDWLVLLYTNPDAHWDWCLYEVGFFAAHRKRRLITLYSEGMEPSGPMRQWQPVCASKKDWNKLLDEIFGQPPHPGAKPINKLLADNEKHLEDLADAMIQIVGRKPTIEYYNNYVLLTLNHEQVDRLKQEEEVPGEATAESDKGSLEIFGRRKKDFGDWRWAELVGQLQPEETGWTKSLAVCMKKAAEWGKVDACLPQFRSWHVEPKDGKVYRPVLHRLDRLPGELLRFKVTLVEIPPGEDPRPPGELGTISMLTTIARRFRWGVLENCVDRLSRLHAVAESKREEEIDECLKSFGIALQRAEAESAHLGFLREETIRLAFSTDQDKNKIGEIFKKWKVLREAILKCKDEKNMQGFSKNLEKLRDMNKEFLLITLNRYHELVKGVAR